MCRYAPMPTIVLPARPAAMPIRLSAYPPGIAPGEVPR